MRMTLFLLLIQTFGIILTLGMSALINRLGMQAANISICVTLLVGTIATGKTLTLNTINRTILNSRTVVDGQI